MDHRVLWTVFDAAAAVVAVAVMIHYYGRYPSQKWPYIVKPDPQCTQSC